MKHGIIRSIYFALFLCSVLFVNGQEAAAEDNVIGFNSDRWELSPGSKVVNYKGRECLQGSALLRDVVFEDGVIEVDVIFTGSRGFPGIRFRGQDGRNSEEFYIRPHKSGKPDALQYTPVIKGLSAWQLYYGAGATAPYRFKNHEWLHVRLEVKGTQARVFLGSRKTPALLIHELKRGHSKGSLGLSNAMPGIAHFSNFKFQALDTLDFSAPPAVSTPLGMMMNWELSSSFKYNRINMKTYPLGDKKQDIQWIMAETEPSGLVNVSRHIEKGPIIPDVILARTWIEADLDRDMPFRFGYSDIVSVFLNGRLFFHGSNLFQSRDPFFQGRVGLFEEVYLPLKKGKNELLLVLAESMGGWGFMGCDGAAEYLHPDLTSEWTLDHRLSYPETVLYDGKRDSLYVSNLYSDTTQSLSRMSVDGDILDEEWVTGLVNPTGMVVIGDRLFVAEMRTLAEIDIPTGTVTARHSPDSAVFLNDVAADDKGRLYVTDGQAGRILRFSEGEFSVFKQGREFAGVNGLHWDGKRLLAGVSGDGRLKAVDPESGEVSVVAEFGPGTILDGIESDGQGNVLVSDFNGKVYLISPEGKITLLLDTTTSKSYCANFAFIPSKNRIVIPSLNGNTIRAYSLKTGDKR